MSLKPLDVFLLAIDSMYEFAGMEWDGVFVGWVRYWADGFAAEIDVEGSYDPSSPLPLRTSHIVLGLYETILAMSTDVRFSEVTTTMSSQQRQLGILQIRRLAISSNNNDTLVDVGSPESETTRSVANGPTGVIVDPDDSRFTISYSYDGGRINSKDMFIAILEALAITAEYSNATPFLSLATTSASRKCEITVSTAPSESRLRYGFVTKALRMLTWDVILRLKVFAEMKFKLNLDRQDVAEGYFRALPGGNEIGTAK